MTPPCPVCHANGVISTPLAGPDAAFHCPTCDRSFSTGDLVV